ncbi:hypothetical protein DDD_0210 [Nonlabens dokdonensis DSW-6]|uniref:Uncharacterized protein n=1 Tax=Nonlabens dokdonensis (strain DSM 17205 / KCTC 12402 / DSW-6) TaxID=592029 RepID=L7W599_NONDD|nr:hypothetical protein DDD_0210 [Nonlabens dokdonensis DSW-6]
MSFQNIWLKGLIEGKITVQHLSGIHFGSRSSKELRILTGC